MNVGGQVNSSAFGFKEETTIQKKGDPKMTAANNNNNIVLSLFLFTRRPPFVDVIGS